MKTRGLQSSEAVGILYCKEPSNFSAELDEFKKNLLAQQASPETLVSAIY